MEQNKPHQAHTTNATAAQELFLPAADGQSQPSNTSMSSGLEGSGPPHGSNAVHGDAHGDADHGPHRPHSDTLSSQPPPYSEVDRHAAPVDAQETGDMYGPPKGQPPSFNIIPPTPSASLRSNATSMAQANRADTKQHQEETGAVGAVAPIEEHEPSAVHENVTPSSSAYPHSGEEHTFDQAPEPEASAAGAPPTFTPASQVYPSEQAASLPPAMRTDHGYLPDRKPAPPIERETRPDLPTRHSESPPAKPPRPGLDAKAFTRTPSTEGFAPPPQRIRQDFGEDDPSSPIHYLRDPHKLIAYLVPFPIPHLSKAPSSAVPTRFLIYTPPPPPLQKPVEGQKEGMLHKAQRKWQDEVRSARTSTATTASWAGIRSKMTRGVSKAMTYTTSSNLDFLSRVSPAHSPATSRSASPGSPEEGSTTHKTIGVEEIVLCYPPDIKLTPEGMREEFVNTMLRTKSKAVRDSVISTSLLPIAYGIDILAGPMGGLGEIDTVWAYASIRGAKTARNVTKRLSSSASAPKTPNPAEAAAPSDTPPDQSALEKSSLKLTFNPSPRLTLLTRYLTAECNRVAPKLFPSYKTPPTESDVLEAIGWSSHRRDMEDRNWEDEKWEMQEVKEDIKLTFHKAAKEWRRWCEGFEKKPEQRINK